MYTLDQIDQIVHSELFGTLVKICFEKWCTTVHYFAFLYMNYGRKKLNVHLLEVTIPSLEIYYTTKYTLKIGLNLELDVVEYENIMINYGERQGMGIKDKADKIKSNMD